VTFRPTWRDISLALLILLLAFSYRVVVILDRAAAPAVSQWDPTAGGGDQGVYYNAIAEYHAGTFPPPTYFFQPGMSWYMVLASGLLRSDSVGALRIFGAALAALNCGVLVLVGWLAFDRRWPGHLGGLLLALYPVAAFYDTDFTITSQGTIIVTFMLLGVLCLWRNPRAWLAGMVTGAAFGLAAIMRFELVLVGLTAFGWLLIVRRRSALLPLGIAVLAAGVFVVPVALHNRAGGAGYLITPVGSAEIYRGNNRDTAGDYGGGNASDTAYGNYIYYVLQDALLSPRRFIEFELHKLGMALSYKEPGNNLNYALNGVAVSPVLRLNPLNFQILLLLFLISIPFTIRQRALWLCIGMALALLIGMLFIWVEARIRTPVIAVLIPVAAYGLVRAAEIARSRTWRLDRRAFGVPAALLFVVIINGAEAALPTRETASALPANASVVNALYDNGTLKLLGWRVEDAYSPPGAISPTRPYVVALYWQLQKPAMVDYSFGLAFVLDDQRLFGFDHPIGTVSYPPSPTTAWQQGIIYIERASIGMRRYDLPRERTGVVTLTVYPEREQARPFVPQGGVGATLQIAQAAIMVDQGAPFTIKTQEPGIAFGGLLTLKGWVAPLEARAGEQIAIQLAWEASQQVRNSYTIGLYLFDAAGNSIVHLDTPLRNGELLTNALLPGYRIEETRTLRLPATAGDYTLELILYDPVTGDRLAVAQGKDNVFRLGRLRVVQ